MLGAQLLVKCLENEKVECVFGMCGHTILAVLDAMRYESDIRFVSMRHEQIAAHAADAYYRTTHKPAVMLLHVGPGMTNAITGVATAALDSTPMVIISGNIQSYFFGKDPHQEIRRHADGSQHEIYRPFVKRTWQVHSPDQLPDVIAQAFNVATSGRPGPVLIDVPMDIFSKETLRQPSEARGRRLTGRMGSGDPGEIARAAELLLGAERPVIYAGGGVIHSEASAALKSVAELLNCPVATSLMGKGSFAEDNGLAMGVTGVYGNPAANAACSEASVVLAVGTRFTEFDTNSWQAGYTFNIPSSQLIHIDIDPEEIGKVYPVEIGIQGDAFATLSALLARLEAKISTGERRWSGWLADLKKRRQDWWASIREGQFSDDIPVRPERIISEVRTVLGPDGLVFTDTGWNKNGVGSRYQITRPMTHFAPGGFATMGFGPAAILGAKVALPDRKAVALVGDGAFSSVMPVVPSAVDNGLSPVWVVMNNQSYGVIAGMQKRNFGRVAWTEFFENGEQGAYYTPDYAGFARSCGAEGTRVDNPGDLRGVLEEALNAHRPWVIDVMMDRNISTPSKGSWDVNELLAKGADLR